MLRIVVILLMSGMMLSGPLFSQELTARISVNAVQVSSQTDKKIFQTLQAGVTNFLNTRKWTNETFKVNEKIVCNFLINVTEAMGGNVYKATLTATGGIKIKGNIIGSQLYSGYFAVIFNRL